MSAENVTSQIRASVNRTTGSVAFVATARPTFAVDIAEKKAQQARDLLLELGADVVGPDGLVMTPEEVSAAIPAVRAARLRVHACASFSDASPALALYSGLPEPVLLWSFREPGAVGERLLLNSMCGANLAGHALVRGGGQVRHLHGDPDEPHVREALRAAVADGVLPSAPDLPVRSSGTAAGSTVAQSVSTALELLRGRRIGLVGDAPPGFTPSEYDPDLLEALFGLHVEALSVEDAFERIQATESACPDDVATERAAAAAAQPSLDSLDAAVVERHAAVTTALAAWTGEADLSAVAVRCWPEFPTRLGVCPCSSLSRLADAGTPTTCERDVYGAVTMLLLEALGAGTTYLVDTVDVEEQAGIVRLWHCGSAATSLAADPTDATQFVHCNRKIGVAGNFPLKPGQVTMARLTEDVGSAGGSGAGLRLLIARGESLPAPNRFQGNTATVRLDNPAGAFVDALVTHGFPHHTVLAWTDVRPALRATADHLGIPVVEF